MRSATGGYVDLRSDTVTRPSAAMRRAMADAEVGDDWYGDDPTVNRLQDAAAELTGKQAAIYLPTGTLCNQIALHAFVRPGRFVVCEASAHVGGTEAASAAAMSGIAFRRVPGRRPGLLLDAEQVAEALAADPYDVQVADLVTVENTHQLGGGSVMPAASVAAIGAVCAERGVPLYLDGARIFNAAVAAGATVADFATPVDALMFSLSKGLAAPIGSLLAGDLELIREARRLKILYGAAWRQAGIMAAAGLIALAEGPKRLHEDHANARLLAAGIAEILPGALDPGQVPTNIVFADVTGTGHHAGEWQHRLAESGVLVTTIHGRLRMLTHADVTAQDVGVALAAWR
ncbi:MAG TPA: threonine aldolase family protein, partial [Streptosporangiaceae bacterium]|nr:threonine aldolase family protein [Streptosporangiaceae bacterium]